MVRQLRKNPSLLVFFFCTSILRIPAWAQQAPTCTPMPSGMVAWWRGDGTATDVVGGHDGTLVGGAGFTPTNCLPGSAGCGMVGQAFSFDGTTGYVLIPNSAALRPPDAISIDAWVYPTSFSGARLIISKYNSFYPAGTGASWALLLREPGHVGWYVQDVQPSLEQNVVTEVALPLGTWSHVAGTFDASTQTTAVYINGQQVSTACHPAVVCGPVTSIMQSPSPVMIGAYTANSFGGVAGYWSGQIDEVEVYNRALSPAEIQAIFNAGSAGKCRAATFASILTDINNALQLGLIDNNGIANSLSQKIRAAQDATVPARANILNAFKHEVTAQAGKHITGIAIQMLLQDANSVLSQN